MYNFDFEKPSTIADAVSALAADEAQALGGGQTLIPTLKQRFGQPLKIGKPFWHCRNEGCLRS